MIKKQRRRRGSYVVGPNGMPLTLADLPPPTTKRWVIRRKAEVVAAVSGGLLTLEDACKRYMLSVEEFRAWRQAIARHGMIGLRATRPPGEAKAAAWYLKSARKGNAAAQNALGVMYDLGDYVPQNSFEAVKWYRLAAMNDNAMAMFALAKKYGGGDGVQQDDVRAHLWSTLAISRFEKRQNDLVDDPKRAIVKHAIAYRDELSSRLTSADLSEAKRLALEWRSNKAAAAVEENIADESRRSPSDEARDGFPALPR